MKKSGHLETMRLPLTSALMRDCSVYYEINDGTLILTILESLYVGINSLLSWKKVIVPSDPPLLSDYLKLHLGKDKLHRKS